MAEEIVKIVSIRGFVYEKGRIIQPGDILEMTKKASYQFISASQAKIATPEAIQEVKDRLAADQAERERIKIQDGRAREAFLALARPAAAAK